MFTRRSVLHLSPLLTAPAVALSGCGGASAVKIASVPGGADILIDGKAAGRTPADGTFMHVDMTAGQHLIEARGGGNALFENYADHSLNVGSADVPELRLVLQPRLRPGLGWERRVSWPGHDPVHALAQIGSQALLAATLDKVGDKHGLTVAQTDAAGREMWRTTHGTADDMRLRAVIALADGAFAVMANATDPATQRMRVWVTAFDANGSRLWSVVLGPMDGDTEGHSLAAPNRRRLIVAGRSKGMLWAAELDPHGGVAWQRVFDGAAAPGPLHAPAAYGPAIALPAPGGTALVLGVRPIATPGAAAGAPARHEVFALDLAPGEAQPRYRSLLEQPPFAFSGTVSSPQGPRAVVNDATRLLMADAALAANGDVVLALRGFLGSVLAACHVLRCDAAGKVLWRTAVRPYDLAKTVRGPQAAAVTVAGNGDILVGGTDMVAATGMWAGQSFLNRPWIARLGGNCALIDEYVADVRTHTRLFRIEARGDGVLFQCASFTIAGLRPIHHTWIAGIDRWPPA